jgi:hypothetical protein
MPKEKDTEQSVKAYDELAVEDEVRDVEIPENEENTGAKSFSDKEDENDDITDMQAVMRKLFPKQPKNEGNLAMVARVAPDVFMPLLGMMATDEIMMADDDAVINVSDVYLKNYALLSIGLDGKGRIDALELGGAAKDAKMKEQSTSIL